MFTKVLWCFSVAVVVSFDSSTYSIDEDNGPVQPVLILSGPSRIIVTVEVVNADLTATGTICMWV